jgi:hypothetical protein
MRTAANLYTTVKGAARHNTNLNTNLQAVGMAAEAERSKKQKEKEDRKLLEREAEAKRKAQKAAEKEAANKKHQPNKQRKPFNFDQEKPAILSSIANASQCSNNLVNALKLVNREKESIADNNRVQETLAAAKAARKQIVRYVQVRVITRNKRVPTEVSAAGRK